MAVLAVQSKRVRIVVFLYWRCSDGLRSSRSVLVCPKPERTARVGLKMVRRLSGIGWTFRLKAMSPSTLANPTLVEKSSESNFKAFLKQDRLTHASCFWRTHIADVECLARCCIFPLHPVAALIRRRYDSDIPELSSAQPDRKQCKIC